MKRFKRIYLEITNICNLNCHFCLPHNRAPRSMTIEEFTNILEQIQPYTDYIYLHVKGEPLSHKNLNDLLRISGEMGFQVQITTNGTLLHKAWDALRDNNSLRQINISLHSLSQNDMMGMDLYLNMVIAKANYFSQSTNVISSLRLWNLEKLVREITIADHPQSPNLSILERLQEEYQIPWDILTTIGKTNHGVKLAPRIYLNSDYQFEWPALNNSTYDLKGTCQGVKNQIAILSDGTVVPCCLDGDGVVNLGNVFQERFSDILLNERTQYMLEGFMKGQLTEELCRHCSFRKRFDKR